MFYEQELASFADLMKRLRVLDQDSGVRLVGGSARRSFLVFVTRFGPRYTVMTYTMNKVGIPGRKLESIEFGTLKGLEGTLRKFVPGRLRAWVY
ncbi:MAG: hypothetical protein KGI38_01085 [Thaumarchaeota archaeon]|nr:hypothetical protein [Nitrososphaerota archaeon]